jgi:SAM-dependent methyltransferase
MQTQGYSEKLFAGLKLSDQDWTSYLKEAHRDAPGMTPPAFAGYRTREGLNSYQVLAAALDTMASGPKRVLDLACGDGFLLQYLLPRLESGSHVMAVDMVASELERARSIYHQVEYRCEQAQDLSLATGSVDVVLCHLALMLMLPIDPVLEQLGRILKSRGKLAAVIGAPRPEGALETQVGSFVRTFVKAHFPQMGSPRMGDERFGSEAGLKQLFGPTSGFADDLVIRDFSIQVSCALGDFWDFYKDMYLVGLLPAEQKARLLTELMDFLAPHCNASGQVALEVPLRKFEVSKR